MKKGAENIAENNFHVNGFAHRPLRIKLVACR